MWFLYADAHHVQNEPPSADELVIPKRYGRLVLGGALPHQLLYELPVEPPHLAERDWRMLSARARVLTLSAGDHIVQDGNLNGCVYRVRSGTVKLEESLYERRRPLLLTAGQVFGEAALLDCAIKLRSTAVAYSTCEVLAIDARLTAELLRLKPRLAWRLCRALAASFSWRLKTLPLELPAASMTGVPAVSAKPADLLEPADVLSRGDYASAHELRDVLGLAPDDVLLKSYPCLLKGTLKDDTGAVYVTQKTLVFHGKALGMSKKESIPLLPGGGGGGTTVEPAKDQQLQVANGKRKHSLKFPAAAHHEHAHSLLQLLIGDGPAPAAGSHPLASLLPKEDEWAELTRGARKVKLSRAEVVVREGEPCTLYKIVKGKCRIEKRAPDGKVYTQGYVRPTQ